jgi:outer membrane protein assembly factor BamB
MKSPTLVVSTILMAAAAGVPQGQEPAAPVATKATFDRLCGSCHEPERSTSSRRTREQWLQTVNQMVARGAEGTDEELLGIVNYLAREHGRINVNLATAADLELVLGLTPAESAALVQYRREHGTFEDAAAVANVPGVDASKLSARRDALVFGSKVAANAGRVPVSALTAANNWPAVGGGPQRENWARAEAMLSRDTAGAIELIYSRKLDNQSRATYSLTPPLVLGNLISYRGFKEMLFVGGSSDNVYSVDAVLNRVLWSTKLPVSGNPLAKAATDACPGGLGGIVMSGTSAGGPGGIVGAIRRGGPGPAAAAQNAGRSGLVLGLSGGFGRNGLILAVGSDGSIHPLYQSNGAPFGSPLKFLPPNSSVRGLNFFDNTLYASTIDGCGGPNAVYAIDLSQDAMPVAKFETGGSGTLGTAGPAIGNDGVVYVQIATGRGETVGDYHDTVLALSPKTLQVKDYFTPASAPGAPTGMARGITPVVFRWNNKDLVVAATRDGQMFALDSTSIGGTDHRTPLAQTPALGPIRTSFASWEDPDTGTRWIYAPIWGASTPPAGFQRSNGAAPNGAIAAFTVQTRDGRPALTLQWISRDLLTPAVSVANGLVFALSSGDSNNPAALYALDATTGREVFTSGRRVTGVIGPGARGLAVANGRVYFTTQDNTVYCFGIPTEH